MFGNDGFTLDAPEEAGDSRRQQAGRAPRRCGRSSPMLATPSWPVCSSAMPRSTSWPTGSKAVQDVMSTHKFDNATVTITGTPTFLTDINDYLQGGMLILGSIAVLVMMVILLVAFKVRWRLLPLLGMVVGIAWGFGVFGFTGTKLSLVTIAGLPILIGLGIEFAIQIQNRIEEERTVGADRRAVRGHAAAHGPATGRRDHRRSHRLPHGQDLQGPDGAGLRCAPGDRHRRPPDRRHRDTDHHHRRTRAPVTDDERTGHELGRKDGRPPRQPAPSRGAAARGSSPC